MKVIGVETWHNDEVDRKALSNKGQLESDGHALDDDDHHSVGSWRGEGAPKGGSKVILGRVEETES